MFLPTDWLALGVAALGISGLVAGAEWLFRNSGHGAGMRRLVHATVCLFVAATPQVFSGPGPVCVLAAGFVGVNGMAWGNGWWRSLHARRPESWGTVAVPLAVLPAVAVTWGISSDRLLAFQIAFLVLALADPLAGWIGERIDTRRWMQGATWAGTGTFLIVAWGLIGGGLIVGGLPADRAVAAGAAAALVAAVTEAISTRGSDNLFVVLALILTLLPLHGSEMGLLVLWGGLAAGGGLAVLASRWSLLTPRGAGTAGLFAAALVALGGRAWVVPGLIFFGLSSGLSVLPHPSEQENSPRRTIRQVLANGGVAWALLGLWSVLPSEVVWARAACYIGFVGALAAAAADTWATELGTRWARRPWSLRTLRPVAPGTSGAVSLLGSLGGALGAATVVGSAALLGEVGAGSAGGILVGGLLGMAVDSLVGATLQGHYRAGAEAPWRETPVPGAESLRGWRVVDNNVVNLIGTIVGAGSAVLGAILFGG